MPLWFLAGVVSLNWRAPLRVRAVALHVYAPRYGHVTLVVTRNRHGDEEFLATNARDLDLTSVVRRKWNRWSVETVFRDSKQYSGLEACPCWVDQAWVRHVGRVLLTFVVLQILRQTPGESLVAVKERWQLEVKRNGEQPPPPLRACLPDLPATA